MMSDCPPENIEVTDPSQQSRIVDEAACALLQGSDAAEFHSCFDFNHLTEIIESFPPTSSLELCFFRCPSTRLFLHHLNYRENKI